METTTFGGGQQHAGRAIHSIDPGWALAVSSTMSVAIGATLVLVPIFIALPRPFGGDVANAMLPLLTPGHPLGTDLDGNDVLARILFGGQTSLAIAMTVNLAGLCLGGFLGAVSGYLYGAWDTVIMRALDVVMAFPSLILIIAVAQALGPGGLHTVSALMFFSVPAFARVARSSSIALRNREFIVAARVCGVSHWKILYSHVMPNIAPVLLTFMVLAIGITVLLEGALSFLGLGVRPPNPSWGNMIAQGQQVMSVKPSLLLLPSGALVITVLTLNLLGDALRRRWCLR